MQVYDWIIIILALCSLFLFVCGLCEFKKRIEEQKYFIAQKKKNIKLEIELIQKEQELRDLKKC